MLGHRGRTVRSVFPLTLISCSQPLFFKSWSSNSMTYSVEEEVGCRGGNYNNILSVLMMLNSFSLYWKKTNDTWLLLWVLQQDNVRALCFSCFNIEQDKNVTTRMRMRRCVCTKPSTGLLWSSPGVQLRVTERCLRSVTWSRIGRSGRSEQHSNNIIMTTTCTLDVCCSYV